MCWLLRLCYCWSRRLRCCLLGEPSLLETPLLLSETTLRLLLKTPLRLLLKAPLWLLLKAPLLLKSSLLLEALLLLESPLLLLKAPLLRLLLLLQDSTNLSISETLLPQLIYKLLLVLTLTHH